MTSWSQNGITLSSGSDIQIQYVTNPQTQGFREDVDLTLGYEDYNPAYAVDQDGNPVLDQNGFAIFCKQSSLIKINCYSKSWNWYDTNCVSGLYDLRKVLLHELGHALQFDHAPSSVMDTNSINSTDCSGVRDIQAADKAGISCLYPPVCNDNFRYAMGTAPAIWFPCDKPDADVTTTYSDGRVRWRTLREQGTKYYIIEGCHHLNGAQAETLAEEASGIGLHVVPVDVHDYPLLRLVEVEATGRKILRGVTTSSTPALALKPAVAQGAPVDTVRSPVPASSRNIRLGPIRTTSTSNPPTIAIYGTANLAAGIATLQDYYESRGETVGGYIFQGNEPNLDDLIKNEIVATSATYGTKRFHLIGVWRSYGGNTDQPYGDLNDDGIPDVVVTRWPAHTNAGITNMLSKFSTYRTSAKAQNYPRKAMSLLGNIDGLNGNSGPFIAWCADYVEENALPSQVVTSRILETEYLNASQRNIATASQMNSTLPDVITIFATNSWWDAPGEFFDQEYTLSHPWNMNDLTSGSFVRMVIAASCASTRWEPGSPGPNGPQVGWRFVNSPTRGAIAWIGPCNDSFQSTNLAVSEFVQEELWNHPYRSMADSWLIAMQRAYAQYAGDADSIKKLSWWNFIGDPLTPFAELTRTVTTSVENSYDHVVRNAASVPLVSCPNGDGDKLIVKVDMNLSQVVPYATVGDLSLTPPPNRNVGAFQEGRDVTFSHGAVTSQTFGQVNSTTYEGVFTVPGVGGNGADSAMVSLFGAPIGWAKFTTKSLDIHPVASVGVTLADFSRFTTHLYTTPCHCVPGYNGAGKTYSVWADFLKDGDAAHVLPDTLVGLQDFSFFVPHYLHPNVPAQQVAAGRRGTALGAISLTLDEEWPLVGQRKIHATVRLEGVEPFTVMLFALKNNNPSLEFTSWQQNPELTWTALATQVPRDDDQQIVIGVASNGITDVSSAVLGTFDLNVLSNEPLVLGQDDLALVFADLLAEDQSEKSIYGAAQSFMRVVTPPKFVNQVAQNYPNPFNPRTTLAFSIKSASNVSLTIYDVAGRQVRELVSGHRAPGIYKAVWDGTDGRGSRVASGVYFYKLVAGSFTDTKKMIVLK
jgi:hypothetical protein